MPLKNDVMHSANLFSALLVDYDISFLARKVVDFV